MSTIPLENTLVSPMDASAQEQVGINDETVNNAVEFLPATDLVTWHDNSILSNPTNARKKENCYQATVMAMEMLSDLDPQYYQLVRKAVIMGGPHTRNSSIWHITIRLFGRNNAGFFHQVGAMHVPCTEQGKFLASHFEGVTLAHNKDGELVIENIFDMS